MNVTLCLTHDCNLRCRYCYAGRKFRRAMSWEVAQRGIDLGFAAVDKWVDIGFFGGEPLLEMPLLTQCVAYARRRAAETGKKLRLQLTTNGILLTPDRIRYLREEDFYVGVSIDGCREAHEATRPRDDGASSFDANVRGLDLAIASLPRIEVIAVVDPANVRYLAESVRFLADRGAPRIAINPNFLAEWDDDARDELERQYALVADVYVDRYREGRPLWVNFVEAKIITRLKNGFSCRDRCGFGCREIAVAPSGNLYPCERLVSDDTDSRIRMGDVFAGVDLDAQARYRGAIGNIDPECAACTYRHRCMNWCGCTNYALTGSINRTEGAVCWHERVAIREADRAGATLFSEGNPAFLKEHYRTEVTACV